MYNKDDLVFYIKLFITVTIAFIIFISIALKLSAQENATALINSDTIFIEKDKKAENIFKRNVQNKKILCYERNKKDIFDYIFHFISALIGGGLAILGQWMAHKLKEKNNKNSGLKALEIELKGNVSRLEEKYREDLLKTTNDDFRELQNTVSELKPINLPDFKKTDLSKTNEKALEYLLKKHDFYAHFSDFSWNQHKYAIGNYENDDVKKVSEAYMLIGEINTLVNASFYKGINNIAPILSKTIIDAYKSLEEAKTALNNILKN